LRDACINLKKPLLEREALNFLERESVLSETCMPEEGGFMPPSSWSFVLQAPKALEFLSLPGFTSGGWLFFLPLG
jgi:hypothetical protein